MSQLSPQSIKNLLSQYGIEPSKGLGQNFLIDQEVVEKIIESAKIDTEDTIIEIGPGTGILTRELAKLAKSVVAIEKDSKMVEILQRELKEFDNVKIIHGDALAVSPDILPSTHYKLVSNLPYYITAPTIRKFLGAENPPELTSLIIQKEVAERITAKPPKTNLLAVSIHVYAEPKIFSFISKESFWPKPKVDSAIILITPRKEKNEEQFNSSIFFKVVKAGFSQPRKQLLNNIYHSLGLDKETAKKILIEAKIDPTRRAGTVTINEWIKLTKILSSIL